MEHSEIGCLCELGARWCPACHARGWEPLYEEEVWTDAIAVGVHTHDNHLDELELVICAFSEEHEQDYIRGWKQLRSVARESVRDGVVPSEAHFIVKMMWHSQAASYLESEIRGLCGYV